jgi:hypothetical protein
MFLPALVIIRRVSTTIGKYFTCMLYVWICVRILALRQALQLQALLLAAKPHKPSTKAFWGSRSPTTRRRDARQSRWWSSGGPGHFEGRCPYWRKTENNRRQKYENRPPRGTRELPRKSEWRPSNNREADRRVTNRQERSERQRRRADAGVYIKVTTPTTRWLSLRKMPTLARSPRAGCPVCRFMRYL